MDLGGPEGDADRRDPTTIGSEMEVEPEQIRASVEAAHAAVLPRTDGVASCLGKRRAEEAFGHDPERVVAEALREGGKGAEPFPRERAEEVHAAIGELVRDGRVKELLARLGSNARAFGALRNRVKASLDLKAPKPNALEDWRRACALSISRYESEKKESASSKAPPGADGTLSCRLSVCSARVQQNPIKWQGHEFDQSEGAAAVKGDVGGARHWLDANDMIEYLLRNSAVGTVDASSGDSLGQIKHGWYVNFYVPGLSDAVSRFDEEARREASRSEPRGRPDFQKVVFGSGQNNMNEYQLSGWIGAYDVVAVPAHEVLECLRRRDVAIEGTLRVGNRSFTVRLLFDASTVHSFEKGLVDSSPSLKSWLGGAQGGADGSSGAASS